MSKEEEQKRRHVAKQRFNKVVANLFVEGMENDHIVKGMDNNQVVAEAIKLVSTNESLNPKYFSGDLNTAGEHQAVLSKINLLRSGDVLAQADIDDKVRLLYSDFFYLCMALKLDPSKPVTVEDLNLDFEEIQRLCESASEEVQLETLENIGRLVDMLIAEGTDELVNSPAKLRVVVMMLAHPKLVAVELEPWEVLKRFLGLMKHLHEHASALDTLVKWFAKMSIEVLDNFVVQIQMFLTVSMEMAKAEQNVGGVRGAAAIQAVLVMARTGDYARHVRNTLRLLDIFWRAHETRRKLGHDWRTRRRAQLAKQRGEDFDEELVKVIDVCQFHNDAVNECESLLKHDLRETLEANVSQGPSAIQDDRRKDFGLVEFPFVLTAVSKVRMLTIECMLKQREEVVTATLGQMFMSHGRANPFLVLKVRRNEVISDSLQQLSSAGSQNFRKPLKIVFDGEEGVDEGGVQKEFFQILVEQIYKEDYGMFERIDESRNFWFNKNSFEANLQFELFGSVLGLAMYNQVILDVKFPGALYKKLMLVGADDADLDLSDLLDFQPSLAQGLIALLEFEPTDSSFEDVFGPLRFVVEYECYGSMVEAELIEGGKEKAVTFENREDYVRRYCDWIFNTGVKQQYKAFRLGFDKCIANSLFRQLFRPDELELVICGSIELDFEALEKVSQYQDGYTSDSIVIKWFWEVVHSLTPEDKKLFLQFCTGCDRAPVGGLGRMTFIVSRAGPNSDALPTVHTCFNHILIPEYDSKEKLERLIRTALQHSTGFGLM
jgi:hypothetical protein